VCGIAASCTTRVASSGANLSEARKSLDAHAYDVVAQSLMSQAESNALAPNSSNKPSPETMRRIRLLCGV
jgi:hypothetical protein